LENSNPKDEACTLTLHACAVTLMKNPNLRIFFITIKKTQTQKNTNLPGVTLYSFFSTKQQCPFLRHPNEILKIKLKLKEPHAKFQNPCLFAQGQVKKFPQ
jgi:hypothetical protein